VTIFLSIWKKIYFQIERNTTVLTIFLPIPQCGLVCMKEFVMNLRMYSANQKNTLYIFYINIQIFNTLSLSVYKNHSYKL